MEGRGQVMRTAIVSTYPPRACGIGSFAADVRSALLGVDGIDRVEKVVIVNEPSRPQRPGLVATIAQPVRGDYMRAARILGRLDVDVVLLQHEYGIFGGRDGDYVMSLVEELTQPLVVTLHTVLSQPTAHQAEILTAVCRQAELVIVMTDTARRLLVEGGTCADDKVRVVPHGAPPMLAQRAETHALERAAWSPDLRHWGDHRVLLGARDGAWWDAHKVGLCAPPLLTSEGWLLLYHGVRSTAAGSIYRLGLALLDVDHPDRVLARSSEWIFGPDAPYERTGDVGQVVFSCGWLLLDDGDTLRIYYGAADTSVCVATASLTGLLRWLASHSAEPGERPRGNASWRSTVPAQTSSERVCFAAARFSTRRSFNVFCAGFLPVFLGFCEPFIV